MRAPIVAVATIVVNLALPNDDISLFSLAAAWAVAGILVAFGTAVALTRIHRLDHEYRRRGIQGEIRFGLWQARPVVAAWLTASAIFVALAVVR